MGKYKVGWIGTGVMGNAMCQHILKAGYEVTVFNRTRKKAENLLEMGARWAESPGEVAENSEVVFSIVSYPHDVRDVYLSSGGVIERIKKQAVVCDMTTSSPGLAQEIYEQARKKGVQSLDAPVSGGDVGAKQGTLSIMVGGDKEAFDKILPLFNLMGKNINYMGKAGSGQHTKMANQIHIATTIIGAVECLLYAYRAGLNLEQVIEAIGSGAAGSWTINNLGPRIVRRNFEPGFAIEHFIKDMGIALKEAEKMNLSLPGLSLANQFYIAARAQGLEKIGTHALSLVLEKLNNIEIKQT